MKLFRKKITEIIEGRKGCANVQDDILVWGSNKEQHDARFQAVLDRICQAGLKLSEKKCIFGSKDKVFLGHIFSSDSMKPGPRKIEAVRDMSVPTTKQELQRLLGMVTYLGEFIPNLSETVATLRQLLELDVEWHWSNHYNSKFEPIEKLLTESPTLKYYNSTLPAKISVDASKSGLGTVLLKKHENT